MTHAKSLAAMGLSHYAPYQSAFDAVPPRGDTIKPTKARKRGPKRTHIEQVIIALMTPDERKARLLRVNRNTYSPPASQADKDRNAVIAGRGIHLGKVL